jgi:hypothetical protein
LLMIPLITHQVPLHDHIYLINRFFATPIE